MKITSIIAVALLGLTLFACGGASTGGGTTGGDPSPFAGSWSGPISGDLSGNLDTLIAPNGSLVMSGTASGNPGFSGFGTISVAGHVSGELDDDKGPFSGDVALVGGNIQGVIHLPGSTDITVDLHK